MGLFKKKVKKEEAPKLPEIPRLPELPESPMAKEELPQLPSFPNDSLGDKFSQNIIKEAVTGKKEEKEAGDEFARKEEMQKMPKPPMKKQKKEFHPEYAARGITEMGKKEAQPKFEKEMKKTEPIFIRIDKFEEGSHIFEDVKKQVSKIEQMFTSIKNVKEKEEKELGMWEEEIRQIKEKIEKIDSDIFSKIE